VAASVPAGIKVIYRQEYRRCGRQECGTCRVDGPGHGPYWYANWNADGRRHKVYLGRDAPPEAVVDEPRATSARDVAPPRFGTRKQTVSFPPVPAPAQDQGRGDLRVQTLGNFRVWRDGQQLTAGSWSLRKAGALFKCLLGSPGYRAGRDTLIEALWPEVESDAGRRNLRASLHQLRRLLDLPGAAASHIRESGDVLILVPVLDGPGPDNWLDAIAFVNAASRPDLNIDSCRAALALYSGEYLPSDRYEEWAQPQRERLFDTYRSLLLITGKLCAERGDYKESEFYLRQLLGVDSCHEEAATRLIGMLAAQGERAVAVRVYEALDRALQDELGLRPGKELQALHARLLAAQGAPTALDVLPTLPHAPRKSNLPAALTTFIGRDKEIAAVEALLTDAGQDSCRMLTLSGTGGAGKTRLALAVGERLLSRELYEDGAWLAEFAACTSPELISSTVARTFGLREDPISSSDDGMLERLTAFLTARRLLLILDNCEHLVGACAALTAHLLRGCPGLQILTTSRELLGVAGERHYMVPSLSLPAPAHEPVPLEKLAEFEAIALFMARARARAADFSLSRTNAGAVESICRRLDGIPLAIELAAARVGVLGLEEVAVRLDDRFRLLIGGPRSALPRQQTLRAALDWSYNLLDARERLLLRRLAVFGGGWTLDVAEEVCGDGGQGQMDPGTSASTVRQADMHGSDELGAVIERAEILELIDGLAGKSLVSVAATDDGPRYSLLETIRQYAWARLEDAREADSMRYRHARWCLAFVSRADEGLRGSDQASWLNRLEAEHNNIRVALDWSQTVPEASLVCLRTAAPLWRFWTAHGHVYEGRDRLNMILDANTSTMRVPAENGGDPYEWQTARAAVLSGAGNLAEYSGNLQRSRALHEDALRMRRLLGDTTAIASSLGNLANTAAMQGDLVEAAKLYDEALPLFRAQANTWAIAACLSNLGPIVLDLGDVGRARSLLEESLAMRRQMGDTWGIATSLKSLGAIALEDGRFAEAATLQHEALALRRALGDRRAVAESLACCGAVKVAQGEAERAWALLQEAVTLSRALSDKIGLAFELFTIAQTLVALDQPSGAAHVLAASEQLRSSLGIAMSPRQERDRRVMLDWCAGRLSGRAVEGALASGGSRDQEALLSWIVDSPAPRAGTPLALL
jgi:predicted ATPase/DNA-binding SARP family transcriptional activator